MHPSPIAETERPFFPKLSSRHFQRCDLLPINYVPGRPESCSAWRLGANMDDDAPDTITHLLRDYEKTLDDLKREQRLEKEAPTTFAELAAKVTAEVERRSGAERRGKPRTTGDRRVRNEMRRQIR